MANAADIIVNLVAKTGRFERGMKRGQKSMGGFRAAAKSFVLTVGAAGAAITALAQISRGVVLVSITKQAIDANNELGKFATRLGIATDELKVLQIAADFSGQKISALTVGLQRMVRRVQEAALGTGEAKQAIKDLGLDAQKLAALSPDEIFKQIAEKMDGVASQGMRIQLAFKLLDTEGVGLVNTMKLLQSEGFQAVEQAARDMNAVLTDFEVAEFEAAKDQLSLISLAFEGIRNTIGLEMLPLIQLFSEGMQGLAKDANEVTSESDGWVFNFVESLGALAGILQAIGQVIRGIGIIGSALITFFLKPIAKVEEGWNRIADLVPGINIDADNVGITGFIKGMEEARAQQLKLISEGFKIFETMNAYTDKWKEAKAKIKEAAAEIQKQREELAAVSAEMERQLKIRQEAAKAEAAATARQTALNTILNSGQTQSLVIAKKIALINENLVSGEFIKNEQQRNAALTVRASLLDDLVEAQQKEQGIETMADAAKKLQSILKRTTKDSVRIARDIATLNEAILKGEGDRNEILVARKVLIEELIQAQIDEQAQIGKLSEIGLQTLRNMQDILGDFFEAGISGTKNLLSSFTDMVRKMVAQLLARKVLLSFLGIFSKGTGGLASFAQKAIAGLQMGGPLPINQEAMVGEEAPEIFVPKNVLTFPTMSKFPRAVAKDVIERHADGSLPLDQLRIIGKRGAELFKANQSGTVVPMNMFSSDVLKDIERRQFGGPLRINQEAMVGEDKPEIFVPQNLLTFPTVSKFPRAVAEDVAKRHQEGSLPLDQLRLIGRRGTELFKADESGTVVPMNLFSSDVLKDIVHRQGGGPLAAGQPSIVGEAGPELFIPKSAGTVIPNNAGGAVVNIHQNNSFSGSGPLEPATLIPLLEENNRKLKSEFVEELRRGTFG